MRTFWRNRTTSRAVPSSASSSVMRVSIATTSEPSVCASKPSRGLRPQLVLPGLEPLARDLHDAVVAERVVARRERGAHAPAPSRRDAGRARGSWARPAARRGSRGRSSCSRLDVELARDLAVRRSSASRRPRRRPTRRPPTRAAGARAAWPPRARGARARTTARTSAIAASRPLASGPRRPRDSPPGAPRPARPSPQPRDDQVVPQLLGQERRHRAPSRARHCTSAWCSVANAVAVALPEAAARAAHVPVREIVPERLDRPRHARRVVGVERGAGVARELAARAR